MAQLEAMMCASEPIGSTLGNSSSSSAFSGLSAQEGLALSTIFLAVCSLGGLSLDEEVVSNDAPAVGINGYPRIASPSHASTLAHLVVGAAQDGKVNDLFALQAILALQLYLYATRALRPAMHLSGILTREYLPHSAEGF